MAKLYYKQPGRVYRTKKSQRANAWLWRRIALSSLIINTVAIGYLVWMIYG